MKDELNELNEPQAEYATVFQKDSEIEEKPQKVRVSLEKYLEMIAESERRLEYHDGEVIDVQYATEQHGNICTNLTGIIYNCMRGRGCKVYAGDREVWIEECNQMFYPDLLIVDGEHELKSMSKLVNATANPSVVIEVWSENTEGYHWYKKKRFYKRLKSLKQIILVSEDGKYIEVSNRTNNERVWGVIEYSDEYEIVPIGDCEILLKDIYEDVQFENQGQHAPHF